MLFLPCVEVNIKNWPLKHNGIIVSVFQMPSQIAPILTSLLYYMFFANDANSNRDNLQGFFLCTSVLFGLIALVAIIFTGEYHQDENTDDDMPTDKNEDAPLCPQPKLSNLIKLDSISDGIKCIDTQLLFWSQAITPLAGMIMLTNITSMLHSFDLDSLSPAYTTAGPLVTLIIRLFVAYMSDRFMRIISRVEINLILSTITLISWFPCLWFGDNIVFLSVTYFVSISATSISYSLLPLALAERFHESLFGYTYSSALTVASLFNAFTQPVVGYLYDSNVKLGTLECTGFHCFQTTFIFGFCLQVIGTSLQTCHVIYMQMIRHRTH